MNEWMGRKRAKTGEQEEQEEQESNTRERISIRPLTCVSQVCPRITPLAHLRLVVGPRGRGKRSSWPGSSFPHRIQCPPRPAIDPPLPRVRDDTRSK